MLLDRYINQLIGAYDAMFEARRTFHLLEEAGVLNDLGLTEDAQRDDLNGAFTLIAREITDLNFHDLRHEMGSPAVEAGAALHEVQAILGHTTLTMTQRYLNATEAGMKGALKKLEAKRRRARMRAV
jgi:integrase